MARIKTGSRWVALGIAFISVMAGTGAFVGAIIGLIMVLLTQIVLDLGNSMLIFMPASILLGTFSGILLAFFLMLRDMPTLALRTAHAHSPSDTI